MAGEGFAGLMFSFLVVLVSCYLGGEAFRRFRLPPLLGQILAGIVMGLPLIQAFWLEGREVELSFMADLGIVFLLFLTGLKIDYARLKKMEGQALLTAGLSALLPLVFGFAAMKFLGYSDTASLLTGLIISLSGEAVKAKLLMDLGKIRSRLATIMLGASIIDDLLGIASVALVVSLAKAGTSSSELVMIPLKFFAFIGVILVSYWAFSKFIQHAIEGAREENAMALFIAFAIVVALASQTLGLSPMIGAIVAGLIVQAAMIRKTQEKRIAEDLRLASFALIIPFFFFYVGLSFDLDMIFLNPLVFAVVLVAAMAGKFAGALLAKPFLSISWDQASLLGWGMSSRGEIELAVAALAFNFGLLPPEVFSALVAVSFLTTFMFALVLNIEVKRNPRILS